MIKIKIKVNHWRALADKCELVLFAESVEEMQSILMSIFPTTFYTLLPKISKIREDEVFNRQVHHTQGELDFTIHLLEK